MTFAIHPVPIFDSKVPDDVLSVMSYAAFLRGELTKIATSTTDPIARAYAEEALRIPLKHI